MPALAGDHVQVLVAGYELTGDSNSLNISDKRDMYDVSAFGDTTHKFVPGRRAMSLDHAGYLNMAAAGSHPVLRGSAIDGVVSVVLGQNAVAVLGDPMFSLFTLQGKYSAMTEAGKFVPFGAMFVNKGTLGGWGTALAVPVSFTNTTNGSSVNNGASSSNGGAAFLHLLLAAATDRYSITVQGASDSGFTSPITLATFNLDASQLGSERVAIAGNIPQYTRWTATRTSGSAGNTVRIAVNLVRF
ncbi:hypothetical protein ANAEL_00824 [Anaerolineales bacterium]|nr:hypothetical protein ANAEL_00824 [Anaerolineales bacterium]